MSSQVSLTVGDILIAEADVIPRTDVHFIEECGHFPWLEGEKQVEPFFRIPREELSPLEGGTILPTTEGIEVSITMSGASRTPSLSTFSARKRWAFS